MKSHLRTGPVWLSRILLAAAVAFTVQAGLRAESLDALRQQQAQELQLVRERYDALARAAAAKPDGSIDTSLPEYQRLLGEYKAQSQAIRDRYRGLDTRGGEIEDVVKRYQGEVLSTGSRPKDVRADVDLAARNKEAAERLAAEWTSRGDDVLVVRTPDGEAVKYVNKTTDTTLWTPETEGIHRAKVEDFDAWTTEGGLKATGNRDAVSDPRGHFEDNRKKFLHATQDGDMKTVSKSVDKVAEYNRIKNPDDPFYEQASDFRKYLDAREAGVVELGATPDVERQRLQDFRSKAEDIMQQGRARAEEIGDLKQRARADLADQLDAAGHADVADNIRDRAARVEDSLQQARDFNDGVERTHGGTPDAPERVPVADGPDGRVAADAPDGSGRVAAPDADAPGSRTPLVDADGTGRAGPLTEGKSSFAADGPTAASVAEAILGGVETAGNIGDVATRKMGQAVDENRGIGLRDVASGAVEASGAEGMYNVAYQASRDEQIKVEKGEQGQAAALANTAVTIGDQVFVEPVRQIVKQNLDEMESRAAAEGRRPTMAEGAEMYLSTLGEVAGHFTGVKQLTEAFAEAGTYEQRGDYAGQRHALGQFVDRNLTHAEKNLEKLQNSIEQMIHNGDPQDPAVRDKLQAALDQYNAEYDKLQRLSSMAERALGSADAERVRKVQSEAAYATDPRSLLSYANDTLRDRGGQPLEIGKGDTASPSAFDIAGRIKDLETRINDPNTPRAEKDELQLQLLNEIKHLQDLAARQGQRDEDPSGKPEGNEGGAGDTPERPGGGSGDEDPTGGGGGPGTEEGGAPGTGGDDSGEPESADDLFAQWLLDLLEQTPDVATLRDDEAGTPDAGEGGDDSAAPEGSVLDGYLEGGNGGSHASDDLALLAEQHNLEGSSTAGDEAADDARHLLNSAGNAALDSLNQSAAEIAAADAEHSWGNTFADAFEQSLTAGFTNFATAVAVQAVEEVVHQTFDRGDGGAGDRGGGGGASETPPEGGSSRSSLTDTSSGGGQGGAVPTSGGSGSSPAPSPPPAVPMCPNCRIPMVRCGDGQYHCPNSAYVRQFGTGKPPAATPTAAPAAAPAPTPAVAPASVTVPTDDWTPVNVGGETLPQWYLDLGAPTK